MLSVIVYSMVLKSGRQPPPQDCREAGKKAGIADLYAMNTTHAAHIDPISEISSMLLWKAGHSAHEWHHLLPRVLASACDTAVHVPHARTDKFSMAENEEIAGRARAIANEMPWLGVSPRQTTHVRVRGRAVLVVVR